MATNALRFLPGLLLLGMLGGCSALHPRHCAGDAARMQQDTLYFGTATPDGVVADEQWRAFLRDTVTPAFPQGLTSWHADGQWRSDDGTIVHERSYVVTLVHGGDTSSEAAIAAIVVDYKQRFRQEAVLRLDTPVCVSF